MGSFLTRGQAPAVSAAGAMLRTGKAAFYDEVREALGVSDGEYVAGFIYLGHPEDGDGDRPMTRRTPAAELTEWRGI